MPNLIVCIIVFIFSTIEVETSATVQFPGFHRPHRNQHHHHHHSGSHGLHGFQQTFSLQNPGRGSNFHSSAIHKLHPEIHDINFPPENTSRQFHEFRYEGPLGPNFWPTLFPSCAGYYQSPIAIEQQNAKKENFEPFIFKNYDFHHIPATITNNGHSAVVTLPKGMTIKGGHLPGEFEFLNIHFHWGSDSSRGSEHILEQIQYPLELHAVHWNYNYFSPEEAMRNKEGIAVLAVLFHVEPLDNPYIESITKELRNVIKSGSSKNFTANFRLNDLLPENTRNYFRYSGSLTTPECNEVVIWTVFANTVLISERQLNEFRKLLDPENKDRENNFRPTQPLNKRSITLNF